MGSWADHVEDELDEPYVPKKRPMPQAAPPPEQSTNFGRQPQVAPSIEASAAIGQFHHESLEASSRRVSEAPPKESHLQANQGGGFRSNFPNALAVHPSSDQPKPIVTADGSAYNPAATTSVPEGYDTNSPFKFTRDSTTTGLNFKESCFKTTSGELNRTDNSRNGKVVFKSSRNRPLGSSDDNSKPQGK